VRLAVKHPGFLGKPDSRAPAPTESPRDGDPPAGRGCLTPFLAGTKTQKNGCDLNLVNFSEQKIFTKFSPTPFVPPLLSPFLRFSYADATGRGGEYNDVRGPRKVFM
jgi:hypothetical protein